MREVAGCGEGARLAESRHHRLGVHAVLGALELEAALDFAAPWTVIFGPSGSGKSSLLRAGCGLMAGAEVEFLRRDGDAWVRVDEMEPYRRLLGYAPQQSALFPHLSVRENVAFATAQKPKGRAAWKRANDVVDAAIEVFALGDLAGRRPRELSGGEAQRVNLARAFVVPGVRLMLLDEPFSGVDRKMRDAMLPRMKEWLRELDLPVISVTHDVDEALLVGAEVVRLESGRVVAQGPAAEILAEERARMIEVLG
jgi:molybdate transport system ATP-binding protein